MPLTDAEKWNKRYRDSEAHQQSPHPLVLRAAGLLPAGRALDLACGLGRNTLALAALGWHVTAVDVSAVALQSLAAQPLVEIVQADLAAHEFMPAPDSYDLIVKTCYLQRDLFAALLTALRPGGLFVAVIALVDEDPQVKPMNPAFLLQPGELAGYFARAELLHYREGKPETSDALAPRPAMAEIIARRIH